MTQIFNDKGDCVPVTVVKVEKCVPIGKRTVEKDGYKAVILAYGERKLKHTNKPLKGFYDKYKADPETSMLAIDSLGFRRGAGALKNILEENGLTDHPAMAQAKMRGIRALAGHSETTDLTNDVNGGPSGIGISTAAGKAAFWDMMGADPSLKIIAIESEVLQPEVSTTVRHPQLFARAFI